MFLVSFHSWFYAAQSGALLHLQTYPDGENHTPLATTNEVCCAVNIPRGLTNM